MGGAAELCCPPALVPMARQRLAELERRWSRFRADSEISQLNSARGQPVRVHADTVRLLRLSAQAVGETRGAFDPTLLRPLVEAGYDSSRTGDGGRTSVPVDGPMVGAVTSIMLGPDDGDGYRWVSVPRGMSVDPGGIGKGLAADLIVEALLAAGAPGAMVSVGGDLRVAGRSPHGPGWRIGVETPGGEATLASVVLMDGGVATSSIRKRTWTNGGRPMHHLLDPRRGEPSSNGVVGCTVLSDAAGWSEAFTKVAFVHHPDDAVAHYDQKGLAALLVLATGELRWSAGWKDFER